MKALTLKQPWPYAVLRLGKPLDNRTWSPSMRPGTEFCLHGGAIPAGDDRLEAAAILQAWKRRGLAPAGLELEETFVAGIFAAVKLGGVVTRHKSPWFTGPHGILFRDLIELPEPVPCPGALGFWEVPGPVLAKVRDQLAAAARAKEAMVAELARGFEVPANAKGGAR